MYGLAQLVQSRFICDGVFVIVIDSARTSTETWHIVMGTVPKTGVIIFEGIAAAIEMSSCISSYGIFVGITKIIIHGHDVVLIVNDAQLLQQTLDVLIFHIVIDAVGRIECATEFQLLLKHMPIVWAARIIRAKHLFRMVHAMIMFCV